jgi:hypothetical protein
MTMKFMMIVKANKDHEAGIPPSPELMAAIDKMAKEHINDGIMLANGGLLPSSTGARVNVKGGRLKVTDGPFTEAKELVGGFAIFKLDSRAEAIELGKRFMQVHADILGFSYEGELEIREMYDPEADCVDGEPR